MPKYTTIDIAANAIKFHLAEKKTNGTWSAGLQQIAKINEAVLE